MEKHRRITLGTGGWQWPAGLVVLYALPALLPWRANTLPTQMLALSLILAAALIVLSEIDRQKFRLPDAITIPLVLAGILAAAIFGRGIVWHIFSAGLGLTFIVLADQAYRALRGFSGIGLGDAKLFAASGAWLGAEGLPTALLWSCASALLVLVLVHALGQKVGARRAPRVDDAVGYLAGHLVPARA